MANATRSVRYIPDLQGLGDVCSEVWEAWTLKQKSSNIGRSFHYLMFLEKTMRTAMLYIIFCMNLRSADYTMWRDPWTLSLCQTLHEMTVPKFLAYFLNTVGTGTFAGPNGSEFFWSIPDRISEKDAYGFMDSKYMSSYPSFRVIRRLMRNMLDNRPTYMIHLGYTPITVSNRVLWNEKKIRMLPGLRGTFASIDKHLKERLSNMQLDFEPQNNKYNPKFYFQQGDEDYFTYSDRVFDICAEDGLRSVRFRLPSPLRKVSLVPLLVYHPDLDEVNACLPTKYYATCDRTINKSDSDSAGLYRPTIKKESSQLMHENEQVDRYDLELLSSITSHETYSFRHFNRTYASQYFI